MSDENGTGGDKNGVRGFLGGHPLAIFLRLAILSLVVGIVLSILGVTPRNFFASLDLLHDFSTTSASVPSSGCWSMSPSGPCSSCRCG